MNIKEYIESTNLVRKFEDGFFPNYNGFSGKFYEEYEDKRIETEYGKKLTIQEIQGEYMSMIYKNLDDGNYNDSILYYLPNTGKYDLLTIIPISKTKINNFVGEKENIVNEKEIYSYMKNHPNQRIWKSGTWNTLCVELECLEEKDLFYLENKNLITKLPEWVIIP